MSSVCFAPNREAILFRIICATLHTFGISRSGYIVLLNAYRKQRKPLPVTDRSKCPSIGMAPQGSVIGRSIQSVSLISVPILRVVCKSVFPIMVVHHDLCFVSIVPKQRQNAQAPDNHFGSLFRSSQTSHQSA